MRKLVASTFVMSTYVPAGDVPLGSFVQDAPSARELARRARASGQSKGEA